MTRRLVLALVLSAACRAEGGDDDDTGTQTADGDGGDGVTGTQTEDGDGGGSGGGGECEGTEGDSACSGCAKALCCDGLKACESRPECTCFWGCYVAELDLPGCATQCGIGTDHPSIRPLASCAFTSCASECGA